MKVFKFGGASVKDAASVKNIASILHEYTENLVVVISAMGKTTNALERVLQSYMEGNKDAALGELNSIREYHLAIAGELIPAGNAIFPELGNVFTGIEKRLEQASSGSYNQEYDQLVSWGEIISTMIVGHYLNLKGISNQWCDARQFVKTDGTFREAHIDWNMTDRLIREKFTFNNTRIYITQGFIGSTINNLTTTLGREGSDYTAAILAFVLVAESVTVWKDVPGLLNADPKWFDDTVKLEKISYVDAIELAYYGASVIHPKTIQPLRNKGIRLFVKSFLHPADPGTVIGVDDYEKLIPSFIFKMDQVLIHIHPVDFSFIAEENLEKIFRCFARYGLKINLMQNAAVSFDVCVNNDSSRLPGVLTDLENNFRVSCSKGLELITIRYYDENTIIRVLVNKELLLSQRTKTTIQMVVKDLGEKES